MFISEQQALAHYRAAYNNDAYRAVTDEIAWVLGADNELGDGDLRQTPDYIALSNLLTNVALEICGHPAYHGEGWQLATSLQAVTAPRLKSGVLPAETAQNLFYLVDGYLGLYRAYMRQHQDTPNQNAADLVQAARHIAEDAVQKTNGLRGWQGRAGYHLTSSAAGLLLIAHHLITQSFTFSNAVYASEKLRRALRDLRYALREIVIGYRLDTPLPAIFTEADTLLCQMREEI